MENRFIEDLGVFAFEYEGYLSIVRLDKKIRLYTIEFNVSDEENGLFLDYIDDLRETYPTLGAQRRFKKHKLIIPINIKDMDLNVELIRIITLLSEELAARSYTQRCDRSGRTDELGVYRIGNQVEILNREIYFGILENKIEEIHPRGSLAQGYLGALIGMVIGVALWILISQLRILAGIVGYAIAYFGIKGFERAYQTPNRNQIISIGLISIPVIVMSEYLANAVKIFMTNPSVVSFGTFLTQYYPELIRNFGLLQPMAINALIGIVLSVLYMVPSLKQMIRNNSKERIAYPVIDAQEVKQG